MRILLFPAMALLLAACQSAPPVKVADNLDLDRFMGDWYVIANIPTPFEKGAHNALEQYRREGPKQVAITFSYNEDSFQGVRDTRAATGFVREDSNSVWGVRFIWPFKADYRVLYVSPDYRTTIIGRRKRDYLWIMARQPRLDARTLDRLKAIAAERGYDPAKIQPVPQSWPDEARGGG